MARGGETMLYFRLSRVWPLLSMVLKSSSMNNVMNSAINSGTRHPYEGVSELVAAIFALMNSVCGT